MDDGHNIKEVACEITIPPIFIVRFHYYVLTPFRALVQWYHISILRSLIANGIVNIDSCIKPLPLNE